MSTPITPARTAQEAAVSTETTRKRIADMTDAEAHGHDAATSARKIADELDALVREIRAHARLMEKGDGHASRHAADLVNVFVQRYGATGARLWSVIRSAADADREHLDKDGEAAEIERLRTEVARGHHYEEQLLNHVPQDMWAGLGISHYEP